MALWAVRRKVPPPVAASLLVSQAILRAPLSLLNDSVCRLPWPDHDPTRRHATLRSDDGGGRSAVRRHAPAAAARAATTIHARVAHAFRRAEARLQCERTAKAVRHILIFMTSWRQP